MTAHQARNAVLFVKSKTSQKLIGAALAATLVCYGVDRARTPTLATEPPTVGAKVPRGGLVVGRLNTDDDEKAGRIPSGPPSYPSRVEFLRRLKNSADDEYDLLVIGAGATGCGVAVDAASRGLKVAVVERDDFSSGTSSRSTKLVHGGVRYLEKAVLGLDWGQYKLVREALHERSIFLQIAPYLSYQIPIMVPIYKWWQMPYFWAGCKAYDALAGKEGLESSYILTRTKSLRAFPMLRKDKLKGSMVYYDGQHNDSRMNVALALTAVKEGATVLNHCEALSLLKDTDGKVNGALVRDKLTKEEIRVRAKGVVNATGPFTDDILKMDDSTKRETVSPSSGVHVILPDYYSSQKMGLLDPNTSDGRVIFFLPWQGQTIAGTTDAPCSVEANPKAAEKEVDWILSEVKKYLTRDVKVRRDDVLASWSGIRPLVRDPSKENSSELVRSHIIHVSDSKLLTIAGGKWTTYRAMAEETVDKAIEVFELNPTTDCQTAKLKLVGTHDWNETMFIPLIQHYGLETDVAQHLAESYGDQAWAVASCAEKIGSRWPRRGKRLVSLYPYTEAEVRFCTRYEYAEHVVDVLARRLRLAFLNSHAAFEALPKVVNIMAAEKGWDSERRQQEYKEGVAFLHTMGLPDEIANEDRKQTVLDSLPMIFSSQQWNGKELRRAKSVFGTAKSTDTNGLLRMMQELEVVGSSYLDVEFFSELLRRLGLDGSKEFEFQQVLDIYVALREFRKQGTMDSQGQLG